MRDRRASNLLEHRRYSPGSKDHFHCPKFPDTYCSTRLRNFVFAETSAMNLLKIPDNNTIICTKSTDGFIFYYYGYSSSFKNYITKVSKYFQANTDPFATTRMTLEFFAFTRDRYLSAR